MIKIWSADADPPGLRMDRNQSGDTGAKISPQKIKLIQIFSMVRLREFCRPKHMPTWKNIQTWSILVFTPTKATEVTPMPYNGNAIQLNCKPKLQNRLYTYSKSRKYPRNPPCRPKIFENRGDSPRTPLTVREFLEYRGITPEPPLPSVYFKNIGGIPPNPPYRSYIF